MNSTDVDCFVGLHKSAYAAMIVPILCKFVSSETVFVQRKVVGCVGEAMEILTDTSSMAEASREEEADVGALDFVSLSISCVFGNAAPVLCWFLRIAAIGFVVPDIIEDGTGLWWLLDSGGFGTRAL